jgi:hypothetical protein
MPKTDPHPPGLHSISVGSCRACSFFFGLSVKFGRPLQSITTQLERERHPMQFYDFKEFLRLSSVLNYNLSAAALNRYNILLFIIGEKKLALDDQADREHRLIVMEALSYLFNVYDQKRRRLGPMAVLHPLRAAALYSRSCEHINIVSLLSTLFHDILEDIDPLEFEKRRWREMEEQLSGLLENLHSDNEASLVERLHYLTRLDSETYYHYIGRLLEESRQAPDLIEVKLADRLDNTLDMRIDLQDPIDEVDFFETIFQILFVNTYSGYQPKAEHPQSAVLNGSKRLYQLFKNAVILSLIRQMVDIEGNRSAQVLFAALADASLLEAQRTMIHLLGYHHRDPTALRPLLTEAMEYCYNGRTDLVTELDTQWMLDGLFSTYFGHTSGQLRGQQLDRLYRNKPLMIEASIAFIVIFFSFLNDPRYYVKGISAAGITAG